MNLKFGQNFLHNKDLVKNLINKCNFKESDIVLDIGAGEGIITGVLKDKNLKVVSFEIDEFLYSKLNTKFQNSENIKILGEDFLTFNLEKLKNPNFKLNIFSNIPYNQTTKITKKVLIDSGFFEKVYLIVQKESAERLLGVREGLLISLLIFNKFEGKIVYEFKYSDFKPVARVRSVLIYFKKREKNLVSKKDEMLFKDFISFIIMQQKPEIIQRIEKILPPRASVTILKMCEIDIHSPLYEIKKSSFFDLFENFKLNFKQFHHKVEGSYKEYEKINQANVKSFKTRPAPKNEIPRSYKQRSRRNP